MLLYESSLPCSCDAEPDARALRVARHVERRLLMRVLAVAQVHALAELQRQRARETPASTPRTSPSSQAATAASYCAVCANALAASRRRVSDETAPLPRSISASTVAVVERIDDHRHAVVILRRGAHHRRPADVDVLDRVLEAAAGLRDGRGERIEVHDDEIDRLDAVLLHDGVVDAAPAEQAAMDLRVQRLDAPVHDLGKAGDGRHVGDRDALRTQQRRGAAGGEQRSRRARAARARNRPDLPCWRRSAARDVWLRSKCVPCSDNRAPPPVKAGADSFGRHHAQPEMP